MQYCNNLNNMSNLTDREKQYYVSRKLKQDQELVNPCLQEQHLSLKCLEDYNYDHDACKLQFLNYNNCQAFWRKVQADRREKGIKPYLPPPEERLKMKTEYLKSKNK